MGTKELVLFVDLADLTHGVVIGFVEVTKLVAITWEDLFVVTGKDSVHVVRGDRGFFEVNANLSRDLTWAGDGSLLAYEISWTAT